MFSFCVDVEEVKDEPLSPRLLVQPIAATELVPVLSKSQVQADSGKLHAERCTPAQPVESGGRKVAPVLAPCDEPTTQCQPVKVTVVVVDDAIPCEKGTEQPAFMKHNGNELWAMILEKECGSEARTPPLPDAARARRRVSRARAPARGRPSPS